MNISFEFFPPKEDMQEQPLLETIDRLSGFSPDFVSITYGAGGSTRDKTFKWMEILNKKYKNTMMHLTCYGNTTESIDNTCAALREKGCLSVLALRGDPVNNPNDVNSLAFSHAVGLVKHINSKFSDFHISVAGYPEKHLQAKDIKSDISYLKNKVDSGAERVITQLFLENSYFYRFFELAVKSGIDIPIIAGIMPVTSLNQLKRFADLCGIQIPNKLYSLLERNSADAIKIGIDHALSQVRDLLENGIGIHFFTLNKYSSVESVLKQL